MARARIDERRLENDTAYRFGYLSEFIGFGEDDIAAIHATASAVAPLVPILVDAVYDNLSRTTPPSGTSSPGRAATKAPSRRA